MVGYSDASVASNRPYTNLTKLGDVIPDCPVIYRSIPIGTIRLGDDDYITSIILGACASCRTKYLAALYDEVFLDEAAQRTFTNIAFSKNLFGKVASKSDEGRRIVSLILRGVHAGMGIR